MRALNVAVMIIGMAVAGLGVIGVVAPSVLLDFGKSLLTDNGLYVVAAVRVAIGVLLLLAARNSRMPRTLRAIGLVIIVAGLLTPLFGVVRSAAMLDWFSSQGTAIIRVVAMCAIAIGAFIVYAIRPARRSAI
jgi:uncharacterized protein YjeT (DUF2065 family)